MSEKLMFLLSYYLLQITEVILSCIILSETFTYNMRERALRIIVTVHFFSQYTLFFEQYKYHLQVDVKAKISLCGHCLINYFGISLLSSILTFFSTFLSLSLSRYCGSHDVSITTLTIAFIEAKKQKVAFAIHVYS